VKEAWRIGMVAGFYGRIAWLTRPGMGARCGRAKAVNMVDGETVVEIGRDLIGRVSSLLF